jgi:Hsp70 protein.
MADGLIFNTEKQLKEHADKIPADKKSAIESALTELKEAHKAENIDGLDAAMEKLNAAWNAASEDIYAQGQQDPNAGAQQGANQNAGGDDVADADFEEVK